MAIDAPRNNSKDDIDNASTSDDFSVDPPRKHNNVTLDSYLHLSSRRVDLVGDFAGDELFLIEGDSLLRHCFGNALLDYDDGFQMLHASYLVEDFLLQLQQRKCRFHIAFFEANQKLCIPQNVHTDNTSKYLLTRAAVIRHLQKNLSEDHADIQIHRFASVNDDSFLDYLQDSGVYFLMCHDGADHEAGGAPLDTREDSSESLESRIRLRAMILSFIQAGYNVALINGTQTVDTKVMAMVLDNARASKLPSPTPDTALETAVHSDALDTSFLEKTKATDSTLTERELLATIALFQLVNASPESKDLHQFCYHFLAHTALLHALPLSARSMKHVSPSTNHAQLLASFNDRAASILQIKAWGDSLDHSQTICDVADLVDGRLLNAISNGIAVSQMPNSAQVKFDGLLTAFRTICDITVDVDEASTDGQNSDLTAQNSESVQNLKVLPFSNPVFDKHLESIRLEVDNYAIEETSRPSARVFQELSHWHNASKPIVTKTPTPVSAKDESRARKRNQRFMDEMQKYAASLTNSVGRALEPETLVVKSAAAAQAASRNDQKLDRAIGKSSKEKPSKEKPSKDDTTKKGGSKGGKNATKNSGKQAVMESIAAVHAKKAEATNAKVLQAWHVTLKNLSAETHLPSRYLKTGDYLLSLPKDKRDLFGVEVQLYSLNTLIEMAIQAFKSKKQEQSGIVALIWHTTRAIAQSENLTKAIADKIDITVTAFKLPPVDVQKPTQDRVLPFKFALPQSDVPSVKVPSKDFQLLHCGPYLDRSIDSAPDSRVEFEPDGWQRRVLDGIDANKSLFVVAPTSAGKTFISFYAMRKVLEADDEGVLVYVAPTKALVNQIAAEVQARYSKKFKYGGKSVWAIHTRDHRINNPTGCQVLVTVPHVLQIMLLAPSHADSWATRVKRIIFDEVHSISQAEDGVVWEQLLLLSPCPIIALSATVGNPEAFRDWLSSTQKSMGIDLEMVKHPYRYSDLRKFCYVPPQKFMFEGLAEKKGLLTLGLDDVAGFEYVHPVASLVNRKAGIPDDLHLEPRDCFTLWQAMTKFSTDKYGLSPKLDPAKALPDVIRKRDVLQWEKELKLVLASWMADPASPFDSVFEELSGTPSPQEEAYRSRNSAVGGEPQKVEGYKETTLPLLCRLHEQEALPAILFNYDRHACEDVVAKLSNDLREAEEHWKETDPKWTSKIKAFTAWKKLQDKKGDKLAKAAKGKKSTEQSDTGERMSKADLQRDAAGADQSVFDGFDPEAPVDGYHFADYKKIQPSELADYAGQLERRGIPQWLINALARGIGVHHAGMNRKYRQVVEVLFRRGFLRVIVATGTLALGINMPCKTVVFSGDSVFLTALNYRQCAGRAGRRGFDLLGNVVFQDIPRSKMARLISSRLPDLNGHFPITTTLVLRLFTLLQGSKGSKYAVKAINTLLSQPRLYMGGPSFKDQTLHHLRFSIEYLRRQHLLDARGATLNFAGLVSHLYFTENSSFAFHALLKEGFFHRLCADIDTKEKSVVEKLMLVMAHLFGRVYCRNADAEYREKVIKPSSSIVFLPPLPEDAEKVLDDHSEQTLEIFTTYVQSFVDQHLTQSDNTLPLTGMTGGASTKNGSEVAAGLQQTTLPATKIRSQFFALSGHSDDFGSIPELCRSVRSGVFLEESAIPHVAMHSQGLELPLNAYLLDFFKHGDINTLEKSNGIRKSDVWFLLNDFSLILATIITSLMNFMKLKAGTDMDFLDTMGDLDAMQEVEDDGIAAAEEGGEKMVPVAANVAKRPEQPFVSKKKAKNADSWEDMADEEEEAKKQIDAATAKLNQMLEMDDPAWDGQGGERDLLKVLKAFQKLHAEFNVKFKAMWA